MAGYLGPNVYLSPEARKQATPIEQMIGTKARRVRSNDAVGPAIANRENWRTRNGSMSGGYVSPTALVRWLDDNHTDVALPDAWRDDLMVVAADSKSTHRAVYVVFSYSTPIAWRDNREPRTALLTIPRVRYSLTTTSHQSIVQGHRPRNADGSTNWTDPYVVTGRYASVTSADVYVDPDVIRRGKGSSPFGTGGQAAAQFAR